MYNNKSRICKGNKMEMKSKKELENNVENEIENFDEIADESKREFIEKFGKYAVTLPAGALLLMSLGSSKAHAASDSI